jgi:hypothetical protein
MTKSKIDSDCKSRMAAYVAYFSDPAYEAHPYDPFTDTTTPRRRRRRLSVARAINQAKNSGLDVIVDRGDGTSFTFRQRDGDNVSITPANEWDDVQ